MNFGGVACAIYGQTTTVCIYIHTQLWRRRRLCVAAVHLWFTTFAEVDWRHLHVADRVCGFTARRPPLRGCIPPAAIWALLRPVVALQLASSSFSAAATALICLRRLREASKSPRRVAVAYLAVMRYGFVVNRCTVSGHVGRLIAYIYDVLVFSVRSKWVNIARLSG